MFCLSSCQSENSNDDADGANTHGENSGSDLKIGSATVTAITSSSIGRCGAGGPGPTGATRTRGRWRESTAGGGETNEDGG